MTQSQFYSVKTTKNELLYDFCTSELGKTENCGLGYNSMHMSSSLVLVEKGCGTLYIDERAFSVTEGDLILVRCNEPHCFSAKYEKEPITITSISFNIVSVMFLASEWVDYRLVNVLISDDKFCNILKRENSHVREIIKIMYELKEEFFKETPNSSVLKTKFLTILAKVIDYAGYKAPVRAELNSRYVNIVWEAVLYIRQHLTEDLSLNMLSREFNMEESHFGRVFKSILGFSPWDYIIRSRIDLAMSYLKETKPHYAITEIANMSGFSNLSNFNRIFKNVTGMTPTRFRKRKL